MAGILSRGAGDLRGSPLGVLRSLRRRSAGANPAESFHRWKRRHILPLLSFAVCLAVLYSVSGADRFNDWDRSGQWLAVTGRCALWAVPVSLALDIAVITAWWLALRIRSLRARLASHFRGVIGRGL
jgi:hypothetical protein